MAMIEALAGVKRFTKQVQTNLQVRVIGRKLDLMTILLTLQLQFVDTKSKLLWELHEGVPLLGADENTSLRFI